MAPRVKHDGRDDEGRRQDDPGLCPIDLQGVFHKERHAGCHAVGGDEAEGLGEGQGQEAAIGCEVAQGVGKRHRRFLRFGGLDHAGLSDQDGDEADAGEDRAHGAPTQAVADDGRESHTKEQCNGEEDHHLGSDVGAFAVVHEHLGKQGVVRVADGAVEAVVDDDGNEEVDEQRDRVVIAIEGGKPEGGEGDEEGNRSVAQPWDPSSETETGAILPVADERVVDGVVDGVDGEGGGGPRWGQVFDVGIEEEE